MVLPRVAAFRSVLRAQSIRTPRTTSYAQFTRQIGRRSYATEGGHHTKQASSDLPWAAAALAVTLPSVYFVLSGNESHSVGPAKVHKPQGHGHSESEEKPEESEPEPAPEPESAPESESESEGESQDTPESSDDESDKPTPKEGGGDVEGVQFKGATKDGGAPDTREHIEDSKGVGKKRINSSYGKPQGAGEPTQEPEGLDSEDKPVASKPAVKGEMSGKQSGLSTTDTKHSTDIGNSSEKSKKGDGVPETAKVKGTVSPNRPLV